MATISNVLYVAVVADGKDPAASAVARILRNPDQARDGIQCIANYLMAIAAGNKNGRVFAAMAGADTGTAGTGTIVCTRDDAAGDTVTIGTVVFTETTSPSTDPKLGQFARGATDTTCGDNLAAAINAHPNLKGFLTAAAVTGTITLTMVAKGLHGNLLNLATSDATAFACTAPTNGAEGTLTTGGELRVYNKQ